ncbi:hypothetical protein C2S53_017312 [Perilla frutescens var. hirtella]|uniref:CCHC-type domain-containing protein n=1 Tax=Perilla frutescens var. hirtella TaxID=608512 RepID=A0AAD4P532_PERFH|nr:hypothetical protein C2S53_017312 [Perilla frutescens var. hirtella]
MTKANRKFSWRNAREDEIGFNLDHDANSSAQPALESPNEHSETHQSGVRGTEQSTLYLGQKSYFKKNGFKKKLTKEEKSKLRCDQCGKTGHLKRDCFEIHGVPDWYKRFKEDKGNNRATHVDHTDASKQFGFDMHVQNIPTDFGKVGNGNERESIPIPDAWYRGMGIKINMARSPFNYRRRRLLCTMWTMYGMLTVCLVLILYQIVILANKRSRSRQIKSKEEKQIDRMKWVFTLTKKSDAICISELRMDRRTFAILCEMARDVGGLKATRNSSLEEIMAIFLYVLAHHKKSRTVSLLFHHSRETVSRQFNLCLRAILQLHTILLKKPEPILDDCQEDRWKPFKGCLGALDGTFIQVTPPKEEKQRYRTRKGGSAHDGRVLRDAINRPNGLKVPQGCYYLVDAGYCNSEGFLAPYRGHRYHLNEMERDTFGNNKADKHDAPYGRGKNKHFWTEEESWALIRCLQEMAVDPLWKTDGGFKNNYMNEIRRIMMQKLPTFTKEVKHIDSRIKFLKAKFHAICEMCKQSGCAWNDVDNKIQCERTWYDEWSKIHKEAKGLYNVSFPYLSDLEIVYGKDRATGLVAEDPITAAENTINVDVDLSITDDSASNDNDVEVDSISQQQQSGSSSSKKKRKQSSSKVQTFLKKAKAKHVPNIESEFKALSDQVVGFMNTVSSHFESMSAFVQGKYSKMPEVLGVG